MKLKHSGILALLCSFTIGCEPPPTEELLIITFGAGAKAPPVEVDTLCSNGGCEALVELEAQLAYEPDEMSAVESEVEILRYRVDYEIPSAGADAPAVPFYAGDTSLVVPIGGAERFNVVVAGDLQRAFMRAEHPVESVQARATLTLAGYDHNNALVLPSARFDLHFDDFIQGGQP